VKRAITILASGLLVACVGYCVFYFLGTASHRSLLASKTPELLWLKKEFNLSDAEFMRVSRLHEVYLPQCKERCLRIQELSGRFTKIINSATQMTPEIEKLLAERARLRADSQAEMLKHFFEVSRTMPSKQGQRYLAWVQEHTCLRERTINHGEMKCSEAVEAHPHE
jgi:hypothetical protein